VFEDFGIDPLSHGLQPATLFQSKSHGVALRGRTAPCKCGKS
jgi:hypothetical protein